MDSILRDIDREHGKMETGISNLNRHYGNLRDYVSQYLKTSIIEWAKLVVDHPKALLLIVETTRILNEDGYSTSGDSEPIRLTTLSRVRGEIWDQKLHPAHSKKVEGTEYHGIMFPDLLDKPRLADIWLEVVERLERKHIIVFGADWARQAVRTIQHTHLLDNVACLHNKAKEYYGEFYELSLEKILSYQGIDKRRYELRNSCDRILMLDQIIRNFATGMEKQVQEPEASDDNTFDDHPF